MSEYQYYEFQAIDRPLGEADRKELQAFMSIRIWCGHLPSGLRTRTAE